MSEPATSLHTKVGRIPSGVSSRDRQTIHLDKGKQTRKGIILWCALDPVYLAWWQLAFIVKERQEMILSPRVLSFKAFERLEPCAGKLARTVLSGEGYRNVSLLPGTCSYFFINQASLKKIGDLIFSVYHCETLGMQSYIYAT